MKFLKKLFFLFFLFSININGQTTDQITNNLKWRNIGPANMMGRIAAIDASNSDYSTWFQGSSYLWIVTACDVLVK